MTRRLTLALVLFTLVTGGCKRKARRLSSAELLSVLPMDNPQAGAQLLRGFHALEEGKWRWTASKFSVLLKPPPGSAQNGARLELMLTIPDVVVKELGSVTLSAVAAQSPLAPETYTKAGEQLYARDVPAGALGGDSITIEFATDKTIPAGKLDSRELALVVNRVGLAVRPIK